MTWHLSFKRSGKNQQDPAKPGEGHPDRIGGDESAAVNSLLYALVTFISPTSGSARYGKSCARLTQYERNGCINMQKKACIRIAMQGPRSHWIDRGCSFGPEKAATKHSPFHHTAKSNQKLNCLSKQ
jgi:hypothetical protein